MWREAALVAGKDLRIEARSRVGLWQVVPFRGAGAHSGCVRHRSRQCLPAPRRTRHLLDRRALLHGADHSAERGHRVGRGNHDGLRLSGIDPAGIFLGKAAAVGVPAPGAPGRALGRRDLPLRCPRPGGVAGHRHLVAGHGRPGLRRRALRRALRRPPRAGYALPLLVLPVLAPVLLAGSKAWQAALDGSSSLGAEWLRILIPFAVIYLVIGIVLYGPLQEAA